MSSSLKDVAYHEAGHAILHVLLGYELEYVSIEPNEKTQSLGETKGTIVPSTVTQERLGTRHHPPFTDEERRAIIDT
jgi:ATP-dependent Zn protease